MNQRQKKLNDSDFYNSYEEFIIDYIKYMEEEDKRTKQIIRENEENVQFLRRKLAAEKRNGF
jgi:hypothetical protein